MPTKWFQRAWILFSAGGTCRRLTKSIWGRFSCCAHKEDGNIPLKCTENDLWLQINDHHRDKCKTLHTRGSYDLKRFGDLDKKQQLPGCLGDNCWHESTDQISGVYDCIYMVGENWQHRDWLIESIASGIWKGSWKRLKLNTLPDNQIYCNLLSMFSDTNEAKIFEYNIYIYIYIKCVLP